MKKVISIVILSVFLMTLMLSTGYAAENEKFKFVPYECDLFAVKYQKPEGWNVEMGAEYIKMTPPDNKEIQLNYLEDKYFKGNLDEYFKQYKQQIQSQDKHKSIKLGEKKLMEVAGQGAYYVKIKTSRKDIGHIVFIRNGKPTILILKTPKGKYSQYEPILMKMVETISFYKPKLSK